MAGGGDAAAATNACGSKVARITMGGDHSDSVSPPPHHKQTHDDEGDIVVSLPKSMLLDNEGSGKTKFRTVTAGYHFGHEPVTMTTTTAASNHGQCCSTAGANSTQQPNRHRRASLTKKKTKNKKKKKTTTNKKKTQGHVLRGHEARTASDCTLYLIEIRTLRQILAAVQARDPLRSSNQFEMLERLSITQQDEETGECGEWATSQQQQQQQQE